MKPNFTYSILQYRHSLLLCEAINVGVLFSFPHLERLEFVTGNLSRVRATYHDVDQSFLASLLKNIDLRVKDQSKALFNFHNSGLKLKQYIHNAFLKEDASALQFSDPITVVDTFRDYRAIIKSFSELLLPGTETTDKKTEAIRHNEGFIIRRFLSNILQKDKSLDSSIKRDVVISHNGVHLDFDLAWQNGTYNLVKPISFDLKEGQNIQIKAAQFFGLFTLLSDYADRTNSRFDLLVAKPTQKDLFGSYDQAIKILEQITAPKIIITDGEIEKYSEETAQYLLNSQMN